jgi:hypothetical protein
MCATRTGNSIIPTEAEHDAQHSTKGYAGSFLIGSLRVHYELDSCEDNPEITNTGIEPDKRAQKIGYNFTAPYGGAACDLALHAVDAALTSMGMGWADLIEANRNLSLEERV